MINAQIFQDLFEKPSIQAMLGLSSGQFEDFVAYVLERAGYDVRNVAFRFIQGVDREIYARKSNRRLGGIEIKRFSPPRNVGISVVHGLLGARSLGNGRVPGYIITTSDFARLALDAASNRKAHLISGTNFIRYINYVRKATFEADGTNQYIAINEFDNNSQLINIKKHPQTKVLTIANNKGGVGKTTTTRYLAKELTRLGYKVLVVDFDGQSNLSEIYLKVAPGTISIPNLGDYMSGQCSMRNTITESKLDHIWLMPGHPKLIQYDKGGFANPALEVKFIKDFFESLSPLDGDMNPYPTFDWVIIDTPPSLSTYTRFALGAAHYVLAPLRARKSSLSGTINMLEIMNAMGSLVGKQPFLIGGLVTHFEDDRNTKDELQNLTLMLGTYGSKILDNPIPYDITIEKETGRRETKADAAYEAITQEVITYGNGNTW